MLIGSFGEVIYPSSQFAALRTTLASVDTNVRARAAIDAAIVFGNQATGAIAPIGTTDAQRRASAQRILGAQNDLVQTANKYLGYWVPDGRVSNGPADTAAVNRNDWAALTSKIIYLYSLVFIEIGQFPASARSTIDTITVALTQSMASLPGKLAALPGAAVQYTSENLLQPLVKAATNTMLDTLKNLWPVLALMGAAGVGYLVWRARRP